MFISNRHANVLLKSSAQSDGEQCNSRKFTQIFRQTHSSLSSKCSEVSKCRGQRAAKFVDDGYGFRNERACRDMLGFLIGCSLGPSDALELFRLKQRELVSPILLSERKRCGTVSRPFLYAV